MHVSIHNLFNQCINTISFQAKIKTVKLTIAVILGYILCTAPFFVAQLWGVFGYTSLGKYQILSTNFDKVGIFSATMF